MSKASSNSVHDVYGKSFVLSPGRKSLSMSNIVQDDSNSFLSSRRSSVRSELKSFLSAKHLDDVHVSVKSRSTMTQSRENLYKNEQVSRLLDDLSSAEDEQIAYPNDEPEEHEVHCEVEDLLKLAMDERKGKIEAINVLAELKDNYDKLQKKYAAAETTIDKLR